MLLITSRFFLPDRYGVDVVGAGAGVFEEVVNGRLALKIKMGVGSRRRPVQIVTFILERPQACSTWVIALSLVKFIWIPLLPPSFP